MHYQIFFVRSLFVTGLLALSCVTADIRVPRPSCVISYDDFRTKVINQTWISIYDVDDDESLFPGLLDQVIPVWHPVSDDVVRRASGFFNTGSGSCATSDGNFRLDDKSKAIFVPEGSDFFATPARREWFLSEDLERYIIWVICREPVVGNTCPVSYSTILVKDPRGDSDGDGLSDGEISLNFIPWEKVAKSLKCIDRYFTSRDHPVVRWSWNGDYGFPLPQ